MKIYDITILDKIYREYIYIRIKANNRKEVIKKLNRTVDMQFYYCTSIVEHF